MIEQQNEQLFFNSETCADIESKISIYCSILAGEGQPIQSWHLKHILTYLELCPNDIEAISALAQFYLSTKEYSSAADCLTKAVNLMPHNEQVLEALCIALHKAGRRDEAARVYGVFLRSFPSNIKSVYAYYSEPEDQEFLQMIISEISPDNRREQLCVHMNATMNNSRQASKVSKK